jgi:uncharacterized protein (DUF2147 family)
MCLFCSHTLYNKNSTVLLRVIAIIFASCNNFKFQGQKVMRHSRFYSEIISSILIFLVLSLFFNTSAWASFNSFLGYWKTYDNKSPNPRSIVKIVQGKNYYIGSIVKVFYSEKHPEKICQKCQGVLHNRPLKGLPILWIRASQQRVSAAQCHVLNPDDGKFYSCHVSLARNGNVLKLHPYVGVALFGVTVDWLRTQLK